MPIVEYDDGLKIEFDTTPSPQDIEEAYNQAKGIKSQSPMPQMGGMGGMAPTGMTIKTPMGSIRMAPPKTFQSQVSTQQAKDVGVLDVKRKTYTKDLESFFAVDDVLQDARGNGLGRIGAGGKMVWEGFKQDSTLGRAVAVHDAARKRLRVQLVRAAGDVGNINIVEQKAAEMLIPTQWDDGKTAELKRAFLTQIGKAINDNDGDAVKETLSNFMGTPIYQANLETIKVGNKTYRIPKDEVANFKKEKGIK